MNHNYFDINVHGHPVPNHPGDDHHHLDHPERPRPPVEPGPPEHPEKPDALVTIVVNGVDKTLPIGTKQLSYEEVVKLAYGNYNSSSAIIYSVAYSNGPVENRKGVLVKGDSVCVRKGMIFNVGCSNKS